MVDLDDPGLLTQTEADLPLLGEHDTDDICAYVLSSGSTGSAEADRPHLRQLPLERDGRRLQHRRRPGRPLALLRAAQPHRRAHASWSARRSTGRPRSSTTASTSTAWRRSLREEPITRRLAGHDDAEAAARGRRRPLRPAGDPGRRRPGPGVDAGRGARARRHRRPDLRPHRDLLAGDDARPRGRAAQARLGRAARCSPATSASAAARSSSRARPSPPAATTSRAGSTPATSATSTTKASSTSATGSTT